MNDDYVTDPKENPVGTGHLPVSGEVGVGAPSYHDPLTQDTDDSVVSETSDAAFTQDDES
jgi:hypothetical protein